MNEPTADEVDAVKLLTHPRVYYAMTVEEQEALKTVLRMLPDSLTNPQPALPFEPGVYLDPFGTVWHLHADIGLVRTVDSATNAHDFAPFARLVPERPRVARNRVISTILDAGSATDAQADAVLALFYGTSA